MCASSDPSCLVGKWDLPVRRRRHGPVLCLFEHAVNGLDNGRLLRHGPELVVENGLADDVQRHATGQTGDVDTARRSLPQEPATHTFCEQT